MVTFMIVGIKHADIINGSLDSNALTIFEIFKIVSKLLASSGEQLVSGESDPLAPLFTSFADIEVRWHDTSIIS
jgi:hypothetical protein